MSNANHTPGPWSLCYDGQIDGPDGRAICRFSWDSFKEFNEGNNAQNARLIAAAPELLASLQFAVDLFSAMPVISGTAQVERMRAAIAKARGE